MAVNPAVALGGVGVVALGVVGGLYATGTGTAEVVEPEWRSLSEDAGFWSSNEIHSDYKTKYAGSYGNYLLGVGTAKEGITIDNKVWWEKKFALLTADKLLEGKFKDAKAASGTLTGSEKSLSQICDDAYKAATTNVKASVSDHTNDFVEEQVWKYCSPAEVKIKSVKDESKTPSEYTDNTSLGSNQDEVKKNLVSVESTSKGNEWFWKRKNKELKGNERTTLLAGKTSVKEWCKAAYKTSTLTTTISKENIFKWCSLTGKEVTTG